MGNVFAALTRDRRLPLVALAIALYRTRSRKARSLLAALGELAADAAGESRALRVAADVVGVYVVVALIRRAVDVRRDLRTLTAKKLKDAVGAEVMEVVRVIPAARGKLEAEYAKVEADMEKSLKDPNRERRLTLPARGVAKEEILGKMRALYGKEKSKWHDGWVSGSVYHGGDEHIEMQSEVFALFNITNPLHPDIWPSVMQFEAEIVAMTASLMNGGTQTVTGTMTSGGTESILMAAKAHREWARQTRGVTRPEIVACVTAHAAIDKACEMLGIKLVHVPMEPGTCRVDLGAVRRCVTPDTVMLYGSAPQYPHGIIDDIAGLSEIAVASGCGLHVDCCLGGFVLPFARKLGFDVPDFDFGLPGVTSMSCDTHKYGYAAKGTSVVLYRTPELRRFQYFAYPAWPGGLYVTPSTAGSRPGGLIACTWASLVALGEAGFLEATQKIMDTAKKIEAAARKTRGLRVMGQPQAMVVAFDSREFSIYSFADKMSAKGWALNSLQNPASLHVCVTLPMTAKTDDFIEDMRAAAAECLAEPKKGGGDEGQGRVYGMTSALPAGNVKDILNTYTDVVLKV